MGDKVRIVQIAPEHLTAHSWMAYRLDATEWIDEIKSFLENDNDAKLKIQVVEMEVTEFENLPEYEEHAS